MAMPVMNLGGGAAVGVGVGVGVGGQRWMGSGCCGCRGGVGL
jgi:hypothetical protein